MSIPNLSRKEKKIVSFAFELMRKHPDQVDAGASLTTLPQVTGGLTVWITIAMCLVERKYSWENLMSGIDRAFIRYEHRVVGPQILHLRGIHNAWEKQPDPSQQELAVLEPQFWPENFLKPLAEAGGVEKSLTYDDLLIPRSEWKKIKGWGNVNLPPLRTRELPYNVPTHPNHTAVVEAIISRTEHWLTKGE